MHGPISKIFIIKKIFFEKSSGVFESNKFCLNETNICLNSSNIFWALYKEKKIWLSVLSIKKSLFRRFKTQRSLRFYEFNSTNSYILKPEMRGLFFQSLTDLREI